LMHRIAPLDLPPGLLARLEAIPVSAEARVRFIVETNPIPKPFFLRARCIWRALGEDESVRSVAGRPGKQRNVPRTLSLLFFACKVVARDRGQILAESWAWVRGLFNGAKESPPRASDASTKSG